MAKKKSPAAPRDPATRAVEAAISKIEAAYRSGRKSLRKHGQQLRGRKDRPILKLAEKQGVSRSYVDNSRRFAGVFTRQELQQVFRECRKERFPLGITLIYRSMAIRDRERRAVLLSRVIRERWTQDRLDIEIRKLPGSRSFRGRPRNVPTSSAEVRPQLVSRVTPIKNWMYDVKTQNEGQLESGLLSKIKKAVSVLSELVVAASK